MSYIHTQAHNANCTVFFLLLFILLATTGGCVYINTFLTRRSATNMNMYMFVQIWIFLFSALSLIFPPTCLMKDKKTQILIVRRNHVCTTVVSVQLPGSMPAQNSTFLLASSLSSGHPRVLPISILLGGFMNAVLAIGQNIRGQSILSNTATQSFCRRT